MKIGTLLTTLVLMSYPCLATAGQITLTDPSFENASANFTALAAGNTGSPGGWFTDDTTKAKRQPVTTGSFWGSMANRDGDRAGFAAQFNIVPEGERGASIYQTVQLDAGVTYTLTAGVGTGKGNAGDGTGNVNKNDVKFALAFAPAPIDPATGVPSSSAVLLAETTGVIPNLSGFFTDYSVSYTPTASGAYNIALQNRGWVPNTGANGITSTVFFDNVRLTFVPEPSAALMMIGVSGVGMLMRRRGRKG
jgi:hypothetical protein